MNVDRLIRDPKRVHETLIEKDNRLITQTGCKVYFPKDFTNGKLGSFETNVRVVAIYALVVDDQYYAVSTVAATINFGAATVNVVKVEDVEYLELTYGPGDTVIPDLELLVDGPLVFNIYDYIMARGKTPWYVDYLCDTDKAVASDTVNLFDSMTSHAGVNLKADRAIVEMMVAARARQPKDRTLYYRMQLKQQRDLNTYKPDMIPLRSIAFGATNTTARLMGAYLNEGLNSALVNPTEKLERVESLILA